MSKLVDAKIKCPQCGREYDVKLFRTVWGEHEEMRRLVMNDEVNVCTCPHCRHSFKASYPFMYVDVKQQFAVWWEPVHDSSIDSDAKGYAAMFGPNSFYAAAPRVADWNTFKETIQKYYRGELVGGKIEKLDFSSLKTNASKVRNNGCLGMFVLLMVMSILLII